jgi:single-strand DNA-binding protein
MSALNYNKVILAGHMTADPEIRKTQGGKSVATYSVAVKNGNNDADFFTIISWEAQAEFVCRYFKKGSAILIEGELHQRKFTDAQGNKRSTVEITARNVHFVDSKANTPTEQQSVGKELQNAPQEAEQIGFANTTPQTDFSEMRDDEDLPF